MSMRPTIRQLEYVVAVADEGTISAAARRCHVSQPSLSSQLRQLELQLGGPLFERTARGVLVTTLGREVVGLARGVLDGSDRILAAAETSRSSLSGILRLGSVSTITPYLLPQVLAELDEEFPGLQIELRDDTAERLKAQLEDGHIDVLLVPLPTGMPGVHEVELATDPFVLVAPTGSPLSRLPEPVSLDALDGARLLLLDDPHCFRGQALEVCAQANCSRDTALHATSIAALVQLVRRGLGATLLPRLVLELELGWLGDIALKHFEEPAPGRTLGLVWRKGGAQDDQYGMLASVLMKHAEVLTASVSSPRD